MRTKFAIIAIMILFVASSGCKKDEINPSLTPFGEKAGDEIVNHEDYVNSHRGNLSHPDACDAIARLGANELIPILFKELPGELNTFVTVATDIYRKKADYENFWDNNFGRNDFIKELGGDAIVDNDVRRVLGLLSQGIRGKVIPYVVDGICRGGGVRDQGIDDNFYNTFTDTIPSDIDHPTWKVTYYDEAYYYYYYYAIDPGNYAEAKKMGLPVPTIDELQQLFPLEEIKQQKDLNAYREITRKKYDFTKPNWKPVTAQTTTEK